MEIKQDDIVLVVLQNPREKIWGMLREINQAGVFVRGIDLNSFEELIKATANKTPFYGLSEQFFPMWRIERIARDDADGDIPSMQQQFEDRTGLLFAEV
ncbi:MAG: hypothetical protein HKN25_13250 [Pyrinomonadaceae bacterium]|nr:hypothetical protein [Pyrinomonadaceae bacterium]